MTKEDLTSRQRAHVELMMQIHDLPDCEETWEYLIKVFL